VNESKEGKVISQMKHMWYE